MAVFSRRFMVRMAGACAVAAFLVASAARPLAQAGDESNGLLVFAAASLKTALDELLPALTQAAGVPVRASYAASSALARQIEAGAPADIYISADEDWMNYVAERHLIDDRSRVLLLGNRLVLIAPAGKKPALRIAPGFPLAAALGDDGRLAVADPTAVPAGKYARASLTTLGVWTQVEQRLAPAENVRAALRLVSTGEAPLGIVYGSDAIADPGVVVVGTFPDDSHPPIHYPAAVLAKAGDAARRALAALQTPSARAVFERNGFSRPAQ
jgi:molybdate transport system substrate-binding protein